MRRVVSPADLAVACPLCRAQPGQPCRSTGGHGPMPGVIHRERKRLAELAAERTAVVIDVREHLREIVAANSTRGNDVLLGALLDAIRELSVDDLGLEATRHG